MKQLFFLFTFFVCITSCKNEYYKPEGIIDRTEEFIQKKQGWTLLKDKERVDKYTRIGDSIFGGEIACNVKPLKNVDAKTFKVFAGTKYAKDKNHVYYPLAIPCIDFTDCGVCFYGKVIIESAHPEDFKYLGKEYATDGKNVYFRGELIKSADGETFKVIDGPEFFYFATDKNFVYKHNTLFKDADPSTFYFDKSDKRNMNQKYGSKYIIGDKNKQWEFIPPNTINEIEKQ